MGDFDCNGEQLENAFIQNVLKGQVLYNSTKHALIIMNL